MKVADGYAKLTTAIETNVGFGVKVILMRTHTNKIICALIDNRTYPHILERYEHYISTCTLKHDGACICTSQNIIGGVFEHERRTRLGL